MSNGYQITKASEAIMQWNDMMIEKLIDNGNVTGAFFLIHFKQGIEEKNKQPYISAHKRSAND